MIHEFKEGDKVIWDSGFGYDFGTFIGESETQDYHYKVNMTTGVVRGQNTYLKNEVIPHTHDNEMLMIKKYYNN